jgi:hypothetical protein
MLDPRELVSRVSEILPLDSGFPNLLLRRDELAGVGGLR